MTDTHTFNNALYNLAKISEKDIRSSNYGQILAQITDEMSVEILMCDTYKAIKQTYPISQVGNIVEFIGDGLLLKIDDIIKHRKILTRKRAPARVQRVFDDVMVFVNDHDEDVAKIRYQYWTDKEGYDQYSPLPFTVFPENPKAWNDLRFNNNFVIEELGRILSDKERYVRKDSRSAVLMDYCGDINLITFTDTETGHSMESVKDVGTSGKNTIESFHRKFNALKLYNMLNFIQPFIDNGEKVPGLQKNIRMNHNPNKPTNSAVHITHEPSASMGYDNDDPEIVTEMALMPERSYDSYVGLIEKRAELLASQNVALAA